MLVSRTVADPLLLRCQKGLVHSIGCGGSGGRVGGRGGLVVKSNDCRAKAIRDDQGSPQRQWGKEATPPLPTALPNCLTDFLIVYVYVYVYVYVCVYISLGAWRLPQLK